MSKEVTERFVKCIEALKENNHIKSIRQFAMAVEYHPQNMSDIMRGKRDATVELLKNCIENYNMSPNYIFLGNGEMFLKSDHENDNNDAYKTGNIVYVPRPAYAGYADQFHDNVFVSDLETFTLPEYKFQRGNYRCFDIEGDSMEPSLFSKEKIVCSLIDSNSYINSINNNHVYVVVTSGDVVVKRIMNFIRQKGTIQLISDNDCYKAYELPINEVKEMWKVEVKISAFKSNIKPTISDNDVKIDTLHEKIEDQTKDIQKIYKVLEKLANQNVFA